MRIEKSCLGSEANANECKSVTDVVEVFRSRLANIDLESASTGPSQTVKQGLDGLAENPGWEKKFLFSREAHSSLPNANYTVNYLYVEKHCSCGYRHKIFFHLCFDNRQAIGTHLLRFKLATHLDSKLPNNRPVAVAVVADARAKKKFGWDNAAATYEEFAQALELEYAEILGLELQFLIIRG